MKCKASTWNLSASFYWLQLTAAESAAVNKWKQIDFMLMRHTSFCHRSRIVPPLCTKADLFTVTRKWWSKLSLFAWIKLSTCFMLFQRLHYKNNSQELQWRDLLNRMNINCQNIFVFHTKNFHTFNIGKVCKQ